MQTRQLLSKPFAFALSVLAIAGIAATWNASRTKAFNPQPDPPAAMLGITREQTARLNAFNLGGPSSLPAQVELIWFDTGGNVLAQSVQSVEGGHSVSFDLNGAALSAFESTRIQIIGEVRLQPPSDPERSRVIIATSFEVFDNIGIDAGKTRMGSAPSVRPFDQMATTH